MPAKVVEDLFLEEKITPEFIAESFDSSEEYWRKAKKFLNENWYTQLDRMSTKQQAWVNRILEDCVEMRIEGKVSIQ